MVLRQLDIHMQKKNELDLNKKKTSVGEDMEKLEPSCIIGKKVKWYSHFEK